MNSGRSSIPQASPKNTLFLHETILLSTPLSRSAHSLGCCFADGQSAGVVKSTRRPVRFARSRVSNPRYSRLGSLRYDEQARLDACRSYGWACRGSVRATPLTTLGSFEICHHPTSGVEMSLPQRRAGRNETTRGNL